MLTWLTFSLISITVAHLGQRHWLGAPNEGREEYDDGTEMDRETLEGLCSDQEVRDCCGGRSDNQLAVENDRTPQKCNRDEQTQTYCSDWIIRLCCTQTSRPQIRRAFLGSWYGQRASQRQCWRLIQQAMRYDAPLPRDCCDMWAFYRTCRHYYAQGHGKNVTSSRPPPPPGQPPRPPTTMPPVPPSPPSPPEEPPWPPAELPSTVRVTTNRPPPVPGPPTGPGGFPSWPTRPKTSRLPPWRPSTTRRPKSTTRRPKSTTRRPKSSTRKPKSTTTTSTSTTTTTSGPAPDWPAWLPDNNSPPPFPAWPVSRRTGGESDRRMRWDYNDDYDV